MAGWVGATLLLPSALRVLVADGWHWLGYVADGLWQRRDPRVRSQLLQSNLTLVPAVLVLYMLLVRYGPGLMRDRKTPPLMAAMTVFNCVQILLSCYMLVEFVSSRPRQLVCSAVEVTATPASLRLANACWLFHISKMVDLLDTLFLVLKKDFKRITYLHVFHHASMYISVWLITLFTPGGSCWSGCALNCFVHCVMYTYYLLASLGPRMRPYLWWKRYLTQLQLVQFGLVAVHIIITQVPSVRCGAPSWATAMTFLYLMVISGLFVNFYAQAYRNATAKRPPSKPRFTKPIPDMPFSGSSFAWKIVRSQGLGCFHTND